MRKTTTFTNVLLVGALALLITLPGFAVAQGGTLPTNCKTSVSVDVKNTDGSTSTKTGCGECNTGFYPTSDKLGCQQCNSLCASCDPKTGVCPSCISTAYLAVSGCIACGNGCASCDSTGCLKCSNGFFLDTTKKTCATCSADCDVCTASDKCTTCKASFFLDNGKCTKTQPSSGVNPLLYILGGVILLAIIGAVAYFACANREDGPTGSYNYNQTGGNAGTAYGNTNTNTYGTTGTTYGQTATTYPATNTQYGYANQGQPSQGFFAPQPQTQPAGFRPQGGYGVNTGVNTQGGYVQMGQVGGNRPSAGAQYGFR